MLTLRHCQVDTKTKAATSAEAAKHALADLLVAEYYYCRTVVAIITMINLNYYTNGKSISNRSILCSQ